MTNEEAKVQLKFLYNMEVDRGEYHIAKTIETAIDALENIDRITAERDALMHELRVLSACQNCIKRCDCNRADIVTGSEKKYWEWREARK